MLPEDGIVKSSTKQTGCSRLMVPRISEGVFRVREPVRTAGKTKYMVVQCESIGIRPATLESDTEEGTHRKACSCVVAGQ